MADIRNTLDEREYDKFVESPTRPGKTAVESVTAINLIKQNLNPQSPTSALVGTSSVSVISANPNRKGLVIINTSNKIISLGLGFPAVLNSGITLLSGGTWVMDEFTLTTAQIFAISSSSGSNISIQEFT